MVVQISSKYILLVKQVTGIRIYKHIRREMDGSMDRWTDRKQRYRQDKTRRGTARPDQIKRQDQNRPEQTTPDRQRDRPTNRQIQTDRCR
jgi:hypothetical protein